MYVCECVREKVQEASKEAGENGTDSSPVCQSVWSRYHEENMQTRSRRLKEGEREIDAREEWLGSKGGEAGLRRQTRKEKGLTPRSRSSGGSRRGSRAGGEGRWDSVRWS